LINQLPHRFIFPYLYARNDWYKILDLILFIWLCFVRARIGRKSFIIVSLAYARIVLLFNPNL